jgi:hypothetical protein
MSPVTSARVGYGADGPGGGLSSSSFRAGAASTTGEPPLAQRFTAPNLLLFRKVWVCAVARRRCRVRTFVGAVDS